MLATLPKSRDLAHTMRFLRSICQFRLAFVPSIQDLVAYTTLVSNRTIGELDDNCKAEHDVHGRGKDGPQQGDSAHQPRCPFSYELVKDCSFWESSWVSVDCTRGIRVSLNNLLDAPFAHLSSAGVSGTARGSHGRTVQFQAVHAATGSSSSTVVAVLNRGGAEDPPASGEDGMGASAAAIDLLNYFVETVRLLATLCRERRTANIKLIGELEGTDFDVSSR